MTTYKYILLFIALLFSVGFCPAQKKVELLLAENDDNAAINHLQHLNDYVFIDGVMVSKETILTIPTEKIGVQGNYIRFDIGKNKIYRSRYIVTGIGNIIDFRNKKLLLTEKDEFVAFQGDSVIFETDDIIKGITFSVFNLKTEKYQKIENLNYNPIPQPDVELSETTKPFSINMYRVNGKKEILVKDAGYGEAQPLIGDDVKRKFPIFWLNNTSFLYANFNKSQQMASIYKVNTDNTSEKIADIDAIPASSENTFFEFGEAGTIIYSCGKGRFKIDITKKKAEKIVFESIGNNFSVESEENPKYGRIIKYENKEIDKKWCRFDNAKTMNGFVALQNEKVSGTERSPQGVAVWNAITKWTSIDVSSLAAIIGWIEN